MELVRLGNVLLVLGTCAVAGLGAGAGVHYAMPRSPVAEGVFVAGQRVPDEGSAHTWLEARADKVGQRIVRFRHDEVEVETTLEAVGISVDVSATLAAAGEVAHHGGVAERLAEARRARRGEFDVPFVFAIHEPTARGFLAKIAPQVAREPVDARLDLEARQKIAEVPGRELDVDASLAALAEGTHDEEETIPLVVRAVAPKVALDDLVRVDVSKVVSSFETTFQTFGSGVGRTKNIRNAASKIDGLILAPGQMFSFNDRVGPRTLENGFTWAPEILGDELTPGVGGGTCQLSSTLHVAALYAALEVVERQGHSRISSYTQLGMDATVSYPTTDLKIRNSLPYPILVRAYFPKETVVRVEILGGDPVAKVDYAYGVGRVEDFVRRVTVKPNLAPGTRRRHQKGTRGMDVFSTVTLRFLDGRVEERRYYTGYRPTPEVYWVSPDYDRAQLPPLPDHARGVEGEAGEVAALRAL